MPIINGLIHLQGDTDIFRVEGRALSGIVAEIHARRLNSALGATSRQSRLPPPALAQFPFAPDAASD